MLWVDGYRQVSIFEINHGTVGISDVVGGWVPAGKHL